MVDACLSRFPDAKTALDLGGGHGEYALELARRGVQVTMQDRPGAIAASVAEIVGMHAVTYQHQADAGAVVHNHSPAVTAFALAQLPLPCRYEALLRHGQAVEVPVVAWARGAHRPPSRASPKLSPTRRVPRPCYSPTTAYWPSGPHQRPRRPWWWRWRRRPGLSWPPPPWAGPFRPEALEAVQASRARAGGSR